MISASDGLAVITSKSGSKARLEPVYRNRVWVIIDSGEEEKKIMKRLKEVYGANDWKEDNFQQFSEHDFERYHPEIFQEKVDGIVSLTNASERFERKKELRAEVEKWIEEKGDEAKEAFGVSAKEVIEKLKAIEVEISN